MKQTVGSGGIFIYSPTRTLKEVMRDDLKEEYISYMAETPRAIGSAKEDNDWDLLFEEKIRKIIKLWDECNIPLIHRTYLFLLIQGGPSDSVYIEIELRRLSFLQKAVDHASSKNTREMDLERAILSRKLLRKYSAKEREGLFLPDHLQKEAFQHMILILLPLPHAKEWFFAHSLCSHQLQHKE
ncbi:unnamed protein product [Lactuca saligna]|uniref:NPK1-activating kinesin-like protein C-terminal domain-containing protein n=1 Tax=Lactuca saligna TaxID=75948 RepID=A0AA35USQ3_LACSI|nr:unnamed protein product [Lactuca saligna]